MRDELRFVRSLKDGEFTRKGDEGPRIGGRKSHTRSSRLCVDEVGNNEGSGV